MVNEKAYGKTWWGQKWLQKSYLNIGEKELLIGENYVQKGLVQLFVLNKQFILETTVGGGVGNREYQQQCQLKPLTDVQKKTWINLFLQKPNWLTSLLNKQLPHELSTDVSFAIDLFEPNWEDWKMACSCADWKVPCKHLAAVFLVLSDQIDQDPLWLFRLRGLELLRLLEEEGLDLDKKEAVKIPKLESFIVENYQSKNINGNLASQIDFSIIDNQWKKYIRLLERQTLFYQGDLPKKLQQKLKKAYRYYQQQKYDRSTYEPLHQRLKQTKDLALIVNANNQVINLFAINGTENEPLFALDRVMRDCIGLLETVHVSELSTYADAFIALHTVYRFCLKLLKEQSCLPRLLTCPQGEIIQWIPPYNVNKDIANLIQQLTKLCPVDVLLLENQSLQVFRPQEQILNLCHLFLSYFIKAATELIPEFSTIDKKVEYCCFSGMPTAFGGANEQTIPLSIFNWLQPFYLGQTQYAPILKVTGAKEEEEAQFWVAIEVENRGNKKSNPIEWQHFLRNQDLKEHHFVVMKEVNRLQVYYPDLKKILERGEALTYQPVEFEKIFFEILPILKMLNISIVLPKSLQRLTRPRLGLSISKKESKKSRGKSFMNIKSLLDVKWKIAIGDEMMEVLEFVKLMKSKTGLVKYKEQYLHLKQNDLEHILAQLKTPPPATANQLVQAVLSKSFNDKNVAVSEGVQELFEELRVHKEIAPPKTLKAMLRPYQAVGYSWMYKNAQLNLGSLIADDMGLGKTLQVISLLLKFKEEGLLDQQQALVIVPTSLLTNWINEIQKFAPELQAITYHGAKRRLTTTVDVLITTYGVARIDLDLFNQLDLYCMIIDEAQHIKNVNTAQTEAIKSIKATLNIAMSGTPVENRLAEYWSIMDYVNPNYLGSIAEFTEMYSDPIEKDNNQQRLEAFRKITAPFILRRLKSDKSIIQDLPDKIEQNYEAKLQGIQTEIYQKIVNDTLADLSKFKDDKKKRQGLILKLMGGLKQVCNHPYQYLNTGGRGPELSGKGQVIMDLLARIQYQQEKTLIFTQYRKMGNLLSLWIKERFGFEPMYLHGGCSRSQRDAMVTAFQNDKQQRIFILSLKAAGTGLNLTAANHVIHYDLWWNPAAEAQATDRAYRIGQKKNVQVYRLITKGTLEEKIDAMIQSKKSLANMTVSLGEQWLGDLSDAELADLLKV